MTDDDKERNDEFGLGARALLILLLFNAGTGPDGLLEHVRESILAISYAASLVLMVVATLRYLGLRWEGRRTVAEPHPMPRPDWHAYRAFTDPLFQVPAVLCVILNAVDLTANLLAEPPESEAARWFLAVIAGLAFAAVGGAIWSANQRDEDRNRVASTELQEARRPNQRRTHALRDPWFAVPAVAASFLVLVRRILKDIEEGRPWAVFSPFAIGVLVAVVAAIAGSALHNRRKQARASAASAAAGEQQSVGTTGEDG